MTMVEPGLRRLAVRVPGGSIAVLLREDREDREDAVDRSRVPGREGAADRSRVPGREGTAVRSRAPGRENAAVRSRVPLGEDAADRSREGAAVRDGAADPSAAAGDDRVPVLLVHGVTGSAALWARVTDHLGPGRAVAAVDLRGHGESTVHGSFGAARHVADLNAVLGHLGWARCHLVGVGFGGGLALRLAATGSRAESVTLIGTGLTGTPDRVRPALRALWQLGPATYFAPDSPHWNFGPGVCPEVVAETVRAAEAIPFPVLTRMLEATCVEDFSRYRPSGFPVQVLRGERDGCFSADLAADTARALDARLRVVPGSGPMIMLESPAETVTLLEDFWAAHWVRSDA